MLCYVNVMSWGKLNVANVGNQTFFVPFVPQTFRTILGRFVPSLNSDVSMKLDDADDKPSTPRVPVWTDEGI